MKKDNNSQKKTKQKPTMKETPSMKKNNHPNMQNRRAKQTKTKTIWIREGDVRKLVVRREAPMKKGKGQQR